MLKSITNRNLSRFSKNLLFTGVVLFTLTQGLSVSATTVRPMAPGKTDNSNILSDIRKMYEKLYRITMSHLSPGTR